MTPPDGPSPSDALQIAVVGHTNAGKTSLLRTLTRRVSFGEVSDRPGTTRHVESVDLRIDGRAAVRFYDTPGLEDAVALLALIMRYEDCTNRPGRIQRFLASAEARTDFEQEAKVLRTMLRAEAGFLVIDTREALLPKFADEIELLNSCARPLLPVLNFVRDPASRETEWRAMLSAAGLHAIVRFDAAAPFTGAELDLYQDLGALLPERRQQLGAIRSFLAAEFQVRRRAACDVIANLLIDLATMRETVTREELEDDATRARLIAALRARISQRANRGIDELLALYGFRENDAEEAPLPQVEGRHELDLFNADALLDAASRLGTGAAVGATIGVIADLAVGGLSLGAGAMVGGTIGGLISQGWGPLGRSIGNFFRGIEDLTVEDTVLLVTADYQLKLLLALENRGHAAVSRIASSDVQSGSAVSAEHLRTIIEATQPARSLDEEEGVGSWLGLNATRSKVRSEIAGRLLQAITQIDGASGSGGPRV